MRDLLTLEVADEYSKDSNAWSQLEQLEVVESCVDSNDVTVKAKFISSIFQLDLSAIAAEFRRFSSYSVSGTLELRCTKCSLSRLIIIASVAIHSTSRDSCTLLLAGLLETLSLHLSTPSSWPVYVIDSQSVLASHLGGFGARSSVPQTCSEMWPCLKLYAPLGSLQQWIPYWIIALIRWCLLGLNPGIHVASRPLLLKL